MCKIGKRIKDTFFEMLLNFTQRYSISKSTMPPCDDSHASVVSESGSYISAMWQFVTHPQYQKISHASEATEMSDASVASENESWITGMRKWAMHGFYQKWVMHQSYHKTCHASVVLENESFICSITYWHFATFWSVVFNSGISVQRSSSLVQDSSSLVDMSDVPKHSM